MNSTDRLARLRDSLVSLDATWNHWLRGPEGDRWLDQIANDLGAFAAEYARRFGERPDPLSLVESDPIRGKAFLQFDTLLASVEMKIMIWRVLQGADIRRVEFHYAADTDSQLSVTIRAPGEGDETYHGIPFPDFKVLRHFGMMGRNGKLLLQGYYALR
jgi:hypothetical protein